VLLLPARFCSTSWSLQSRTTLNPSPESGQLSTTTTHHHSNHPGYRPIPGTLSSSHKKPTTNVWTRCSPGNACYPNSTCPIYPLPIANTTQWLQSHSRRSPRVGSRHRHSREFPCLEVSHPPHRKCQLNCRSATRPNMPVSTCGNETPTSQSVNNRQDPRASRHQEPGRGNVETNPYLDQHHQ